MFTGKSEKETTVFRRNEHDLKKSFQLTVKNN